MCTDINTRKKPDNSINVAWKIQNPNGQNELKIGEWKKQSCSKLE